MRKGKWKPGYRKGHGKKKKRDDGFRSDLEAKYSRFLDQMQADGLIEEWRYEEVTFNIAKRTTYTPDFMVIFPDGEIQFHETKGFMREGAWIKLKTVSERMPFRFYVIRCDKGVWSSELVTEETFKKSA